MEKKMSFPDKRYLPRWNVANHIDYHLHDESVTHKGKSRDLSSVGICLQTQTLLPVNSTVKLVVYLSENTSFPVEGRVMWSRVADQGGYLAGIHFEGVAPHDQEMILQFAFEVCRPNLVKHWFNGWPSENE
jgi:hypothetical protein